MTAPKNRGPRNIEEQVSFANEFIEYELNQVDQIRPPVDLRILSESLGINRIRLGDIGPDAILLSRSDNYEIIIKRDTPRTRQRFSWAHELGHFFLERPEPGGVAFRGVTYEKIERECDKLAAAILMPADIFRYHTQKSDYPLYSARGLAALFEVSHESAVRRIPEVSHEPMILTHWSFDLEKSAAPRRNVMHTDKSGWREHGRPIENERPGVPEFKIVRRLLYGESYSYAEEPTFLVNQRGPTSFLEPWLVPTEGIAWGRGKYRRVFTLSHLSRSQRM